MKTRGAITWMAAAALLLAGSASAAQTEADFFDDAVLHDIYLDMHPLDWKKLLDNYKENTYYPANFEWRGNLVENVGVRSRGRVTRSDIKPGLRVDFNRYEDGQEFLTMRSFVLRNNVGDASMLRERISMALYRKMGVPAPREAHARLFVNGQYAGVYLVVESLDKKFLKRTFGEDEGYLYSYEHPGPYRFEYRGDDPELYSPLPFKPETHEKDPEARPLVAMIRTLNQASDADFPAAVSEYLDAKLFLRFLAIEVYLAEWDGILSDEGMNNFYLYRFDKKNLNQFIVWDKDNTFRSPDYPIWKNLDANVLTRRLLAVPEWRNYFLDTLLEAADVAGGPGGFLAEEALRAYYQIRGAVYDDPLKQCDFKACTNEQFEAVAEWVMLITRERSDFVRWEVWAAPR